MSQEPEYLKRLRAQQERKGKSGKAVTPDRPETGAPQYTAQEHEALHRIQWIGVLFDRLDKVQNGRGRDAFGFRVGTV